MAGKIYTRTGDTGDTGLFGGGRVPKDHPRVDAYGTVDELNASLGWARTQIDDTWIGERLETVQHDLFVLGADLATPPSEEGRPEPSTPVLPLARVGEAHELLEGRSAYALRGKVAIDVVGNTVSLPPRR